LRLCHNDNWSGPLIDVASFDFLGLHYHDEVKQQASAALSKYGCGTCGPRGFYGTLDVHLSLEDSIAKFLGTDAAIIYSYDFATSSSVIPCFSKRNDILLVDKACSFGIMHGVKLSRSTVRMFEHNDMDHLERLLLQVQQADEKRGKKPILNRRFIVSEGLFGNTGTIAPLNKIVELANKYKFRTILDESWSFGTLGATGRGATEHHGLQASQVDIICASMSNSLASIGGFCAGSMRVIDHQRLSSTGYCFSASLPPFNAVSSSTGIEIMKKEGSSLFPKLHTNINAMNSALTAAVDKANQSLKGRSFVITLGGHESSTLRHIRLEGHSLQRAHLSTIFARAADISARNGVAVAVATYSPLDDTAPAPSLRVTCSSSISVLDVSLKPSI
jgi:serine palmitoyltransferase